MYRRALTAACVVSAVASPVYADFQTTQWNMSQAQVEQAVQGASPFNGTGKDAQNGDWKTKLWSRYNLGGIEVNAFFGFSSDDRLVVVSLEPHPANCLKMFHSIQQGYGTPEGEARGEVWRNAKWSHPQTGNRLTFLEIGLLGETPSSCTLTYTPILEVGGQNF